MGSGVGSDLPALVGEPPSSSQPIGISSGSCGPPSQWSIPGHDIGRSVPMWSVGAYTVPGKPEPRQDRARQLEDRAVGVVEGDGHDPAAAAAR